MAEFLYQLNSLYNVGQKVKKGKSKFRKNKLIWGLVSIGFAFASLFFLKSARGTCRYHYGVNVFRGALWSFAAFMGIYRFSKLKSDIYIDEAVISGTCGIENLLNKWNNEYFLQNGLYVMAPKNLKYLQFVLDSNIKFTLDDHTSNVFRLSNCK